MKEKFVLRLILLAILSIGIIAMFTACGGSDKVESKSTPTAINSLSLTPTKELSFVTPTPGSATLVAETPTAIPTLVPTAVATNSNSFIAPETLIEDTSGGAEVHEDSIKIDVFGSYTDVAFFSLENSEKFKLSFRISEFLPVENHQQIGIIIAPNVLNFGGLYGKFMRTFSGSNIIEMYGTAESWEVVNSADGTVADPFATKDSIYMQMEAADGKFMFSVSEDGDNWTLLGTFNILFSDELQIGFTGATFTNASASATIDNIKITY